VITLREHYGGPRLLELAKEKDHGFTLETFLVALRSISRLQLVDWSDAGIGKDQVCAIPDACQSAQSSGGLASMHLSAPCGER
jgi:hypothetical protein